MLALAPWEWHADSQALGDLAPRSERYPDYEKAVGGSLAIYLERRNARRLYGDRNYAMTNTGGPGHGITGSTIIPTSACFIFSGEPGGAGMSDSRARGPHSRSARPVRHDKLIRIVIFDFTFGFVSGIAAA
ncbi:hypothetical protein ACFSL6_06770 [Paenibacillus thailandensis]|uniref:Uncharacterized protein n=1 Tax=Paenibacillus thailandensis TaxID=393250 RepID=A0ABW5R3K1_9BACL